MQGGGKAPGKEGKNVKYTVIVDISPKTIPGTKGCHKYVFNDYRTKKEAVKVAAKINANRLMGVATVEKDKKKGR